MFSLKEYLRSKTILSILLILCLVPLGLLTPIAYAAPALDQAVILQYHHISESTPASTSLSPDSFKTHMQYLQDNNFQILPLESVINSLQNQVPLPNKTAVITFDDAYVSVYTEAFPLLRELSWPFTIFVTTGLVGTNKALYANWQQLQEMANSNATIANHTVSHPHLLQVEIGETENDWLARIEAEIVQAETAIAQQTGQQHKILAYPYGEYNSALQSMLTDLGFTGIAQHSGPINIDSDFTALPRFPFSGLYASMNSFPTKVNSLAFSLQLTSPLSPITNLNMPTATLKFNQDGYRLNQLACFNNSERIAVKEIDQADRLFEVSSHINNQSRRFRYNCTAPGEDGRYYWYSIQWINPDIPE